jgi:sacsin
MRNIFTDVPEDQDMVILDDESAAFAREVWTWISMRGINALDKDMSCLWLLPLSNGKYRKIKPEKSISAVYFAPAGELGDLMRRYDAKSSEKPLPLIDARDIGSQSMSSLTRNSCASSDLHLEDGGKIVSFLRWLHRINPTLDNVPEGDIHLIKKVTLLQLPKSLTLVDRGTVVGALKDLKIFQKVSWIETRRERLFTPLCRINPELTYRRKSELIWTNLSSCKKSVGLLDGIQKVPDIDGIQFLIADHSSASEQLLRTLGLAECLRSVDVIQDYIIPAWQGSQPENWTSSCKEQVAEFILSQFSW